MTIADDRQIVAEMRARANLARDAARLGPGGYLFLMTAEQYELAARQLEAILDVLASKRVIPPVTT